METVVSGNGQHRSNDPKLFAMHLTRNKPQQARVIKDDPPMHGFGKELKKDDIVTIEGTTYHPPVGCFCVSVPEECAFYDYNYFELIGEE